MVENIPFDIINKINFSFEFFFPKTVIMRKIFWDSITKLMLLKPKFISLTCSVNSYTENEDTLMLLKEIKQNTGLNPVPHLICVNKNHESLKIIAENFLCNNIKHVIAIRGDIPVLNKRNFVCNMYGVDLVKLLKKTGDFHITVAAYPEVHPDSKSEKYDLINLKKKIDAGASSAITQFFFDPEIYLRFRDKCIAIGINIEIIPGIFPILNYNQLKRFISITNVTIPKWMIMLFERLEYNAETVKIVSAYIIIKIINRLKKEGVENFHFYTLNHSNLTYSICNYLDVIYNNF